jgi:hypothetical protein
MIARAPDMGKPLTLQTVVGSEATLGLGGRRNPRTSGLTGAPTATGTSGGKRAILNLVQLLCCLQSSFNSGDSYLLLSSVTVC